MHQPRRIQSSYSEPMPVKTFFKKQNLFSCCVELCLDLIIRNIKATIWDICDIALAEASTNPIDQAGHIKRKVFNSEAAILHAANEE